MGLSADGASEARRFHTPERQVQLLLSAPMGVSKAALRELYKLLRRVRLAYPQPSQSRLALLKANGLSGRVQTDLGDCAAGPTEGRPPDAGKIRGSIPRRRTKLFDNAVRWHNLVKLGSSSNGKTRALQAWDRGSIPRGSTTPLKLTR